MKPDSKRFYQGWGCCAAFFIASCDQPCMVMDAAKEHGITLEMLEDAECDPADMDVLRPVFKEG